MKCLFPIPATCRPHCRAAFRRVAGGALPKRGRGCAGNGQGQAPEPQRRRVRGGFLPRAGAQRQGRRVSVPFLKMAVPKSKVAVPLLNLALPLICRNSSLPCRRVAGGAVARDAQPYRLQRFERTGVEKKRHDAHEGDAVLVHPRLFVRVAGHDDLAEGVAGMAQRERFLFTFRRVGNYECGLYVDSLRCLVDDKIDFVSSYLVFAGGADAVYGHVAHVHRISALYQLAVDGILHEMGAFVLPEVEAGVAESAIGGVVLEGCVEITFPFYVVAHRLGYDERIGKVVYVLADCHAVRFYAHDGIERVGELGWIGKTADTAHHGGCEHIEHGIVLEIVSLRHITQVDCFVKVCEVAHLLRFGRFEDTFRQTAEIKVFVEDRIKVSGGFSERKEFGHAQRHYVDYFAAASEFRCYVGRKHLGVGAGDIDIDIRNLSKCAQNMVEGDVCVILRLGMEFGEIDTFAQHGIAALDFINEDKCRLVVIWEHRPDMPFELDRVEKGVVFCLFKVDFDYVVLCNAIVQKMPFEYISKKVAFAATPDAGNDLHRAIHFCGNELIKIFWSFDFHPHCAFLFVRKLMFCKVAVLYHIGSALATAPHYKTCGIAMSVKSLGDNTIHAPRRPHRRVAGGASVEMEAA